MNTIEVLIISAILSAIAYVAGLNKGYRLGVKVGTIATIIGFTTMTEADDAPARHIDERV